MHDSVPLSRRISLSVVYYTVRETICEHYLNFFSILLLYYQNCILCIVDSMSLHDDVKHKGSLRT